MYRIQGQAYTLSANFLELKKHSEISLTTQTQNDYLLNIQLSLLPAYVILTIIEFPKNYRKFLLSPLSARLQPAGAT